MASVLLMATTSVAALQESTALTPADLAGAWAGTISHAGQSVPFALELEPDAEGKVLLRATVPAMHLARVPVDKPKLEISGDVAKAGPFTFRFDRAAGTLSGTMPASLLPVYEAPFVLRRVEKIEIAARAEIQAPLAQPAWSFDAGSPLWPGATFADGSVYAGAEDGRLHALDARTGKPRWSFATGGPLRARASVHAGVVYLQSDDGFVYALGAADGAVRWRTRVAEKPVMRLPFDDPKSRYDRYASGVTVSGARLYLGTNEGKLVALDAATGSKAWEFAAGDAVLAAPAVEAGRVFFGSFDKHVYALEAADGRLVWKRDARMPVVSTPAVDRGVVVIGSRSYDLLGLDAATGEPRWTRYVWFSWIESSATVRDGVAYVGSSDAAIVLAVDTRTGHDVWTSDVWGWAWDQPAVTADRVYIGTSGQVGYPVKHRGGALALDRKTGRPAWQFLSPSPASGAYGFTGSPDVGNGLVYFQPSTARCTPSSSSLRSRARARARARPSLAELRASKSPRPPGAAAKAVWGATAPQLQKLPKTPVSSSYMLHNISYRTISIPPPGPGRDNLMSLKARVDPGLSPRFSVPVRGEPMEPLNNFHLASLAFQRVRQLQSGARPRVATNGHKSLYVALEEVEAGLISWEVGAEVRQDGAGIGGSPMVGGND